MDSISSSKLETELEGLISQSIMCFIIDFGELDFISSAGLRTLLAIGKKIKEKEGRLSITSVKEHVQEVFDIAGFTSLFTTYKSTAAALAQVRVYIWGARGSVPANVTAAQMRARICEALVRARGLHLDDDRAIEKFVDSLPFSIRATYGCNTSCVEIQGSHEHILCDAGTGLRDFGRFIMGQQGERNKQAFHIFISHLHWDHIQGFPFFTPAYIPGNTVNIYGCHERLKEAFVLQQERMSFPVPLDHLSGEIVFTVLEPDREYEIGGFKVRAIEQNHPGGSFGYCFSRQGKKVIYSTDSEHQKDADSENYEFLDFIRDADLMIFDAQYTLVDAIEKKKDWGHSSNLLAVELAVKANVKCLCLFHNEHTYDDEQLERFLNETQRYLQLHAGSDTLQVELAYDGLEIDI